MSKFVGVYGGFSAGESLGGHRLTGGVPGGPIQEDALPIEAVRRSFPTPEHPQIFACDGDQRLLPGHPLTFAPMIFGPIKIVLPHAREHGLREHFAQPGPAFLAQAPLALVLPALLQAQVQAAVTQELAPMGEVLQRPRFAQNPGQQKVVDHARDGLQFDLPGLLELLQQADHPLAGGGHALPAALEIGEPFAHAQFQQLDEFGRQLLEHGTLGLGPEPLGGAGPNLELPEPGQTTSPPVGHHPIGVEPVGRDDLPGRRIAEEKVDLEGQLAEEFGQDAMQASSEGHGLGFEFGVVRAPFAQAGPRPRQGAMGEGLAQFDQQEHGARVLLVALGGVVAFHHAEFLDALGVEVRGAMTGLARQAQEASFVTAGRFADDAQVRETVFLGQLGILLQRGLDRTIAVGDGLLDHLVGAVGQRDFGMEIEVILADIGGEGQGGVRIARVEAKTYFHHVFLEWGLEFLRSGDCRCSRPRLKPRSLLFKRLIEDRENRRQPSCLRDRWIFVWFGFRPAPVVGGGLSLGSLGKKRIAMNRVSRIASWLLVVVVCSVVGMGCGATRRERLASFAPYGQIKMGQEVIEKFLESRTALLLSADRLAITPPATATNLTGFEMTAPAVGACLATAVDRRGYFLTCAHCLNTREIHLFFVSAGQGRSEQASVIWKGDAAKIETDLAVLYVPVALDRTFEWASDFKRGDRVFALGQDWDRDDVESAYEVVRRGLAGILVARWDRSKSSTPLVIVAHDTPLHDGDSGGPLVTTDGRLIAINKGIAPYVSAVSFPIVALESVASRPDLNWLLEIIDSHARTITK